MAEKITIHSVFPLSYEEDAIHGMHYLRDHISYEEAKVFFEQAKYHGSAQFEDRQDRNYKLIYEDGGYRLERR